MEQKLGKKEGRFNSTEWDSDSRPRWTSEKANAFWNWFIKANDIPAPDFVKELKREGDPAKALERLFAKTNKLGAMRQKKLRNSSNGRAGLSEVENGDGHGMLRGRHPFLRTRPSDRARAGLRASRSQERSASPAKPKTFALFGCIV